jgi:hypothetical protein
MHTALQADACTQKCNNGYAVGPGEVQANARRSRRLANSDMGLCTTPTQQPNLHACMAHNVGATLRAKRTMVIKGVPTFFGHHPCSPNRLYSLAVGAAAAQCTSTSFTDFRPVQRTDRCATFVKLQHSDTCSVCDHSLSGCSARGPKHRAGRSREPCRPCSSTSRTPRL